VRLAVSNIGWTAGQDATASARLIAAGAEATEVAPGRIFADLALATPAEARRLGAGLAAAGLPAVSMQALLYGQEDLRLFGDRADEGMLLAHFDRLFGLAAALGCGPLVFGAPKNRLKGSMGFAEATRRAVPVLSRIGDLAARHRLTFCLEANARAYGCDFMTRLAEAAEVAAAVDHPAVAVVGDTGNMLMEDEPAEAILAVLDRLAHVHVSAPALASPLAHRDFVAALIGHLGAAGYGGIVTLEMRPGAGADPLADLDGALVMLRGIMDGARG